MHSFTYKPKKVIYAFFVILFFSVRCQCCAFPYSTNVGAYFQAVNIEMQLVNIVLNTNDSKTCPFDSEICESLLSNQGKSQNWTVEYQEISFIFYYSSTNECSQSSQEMSFPDLIIFQNGRISRTNSTDAIPVTYVRLVDKTVRTNMAEVNFLIRVTSNDNYEDVKYYKRSFRYRHENIWKPDKK